MFKDKRLIIKYVLLLTLLLLLVLIGFTIYKNSDIRSKTLNDSNNVRKNYKIYHKQTINFFKILYFNHISGNKKLLEVLDSNYKDQEKVKQITKVFKNKINFFKRYNIKEVNFYSKELNLIYNSRGKLNTLINTSYKIFLQKAKNNFEGLCSIEISSTNAAMRYARPIIDKAFNIIAIVEMVVDVPKFTHGMYLDKEISSQFIFKKDVLKKQLTKDEFSKFTSFELNKNYMYEKSFYNQQMIFKNIDSSLIKDIKINMKNQLEFSELIKNGDSYILAVFTPIINNAKNDIGYIISISYKNKFSALVKKYDYYILISFVVITIFVFFLYITNYLINRYKIVKEKLEDISKSIDKYVIVIETDLNGVVTYVSQAFSDASGYKKNEIIGKPISLVRSPDISKKFFENMWEKLRNEEAWEGEIKNIDKNGNSYWLKGNIVPIYDANKRMIGYRSIRVNVSSEKQLLKMNNLLKRDLFFKLNEIKAIDKLKVDESKVKLMGQILDTFSNEWKKPISNISLRLTEFEDKLQEKKYEEEYLKEFINTLNGEVKALSIRLNEFKTLFSNDDKSDKYNVYSVIKNTLSSIYEDSVEVTLSGDEDSETYGISYDLRKIILGIIYNSIEQFKIKDIANGKISIDISKSKNFITIRCLDNAGGVPEEILSKIFDAEFSTKNDFSSSGLPLHIARLILRKANGEIWVKNEGAGSCFYINLIAQDRRMKKRE